MKYYIPHRLLLINEQVQEDPILMKCMQLAFQWANDMGIKEKKVSHLHLEKPDPYRFDPLNQHYTLCCKIECEEEERSSWNKMKEIEVKKYIFDQISE